MVRGACGGACLLTVRSDEAPEVPVEYNANELGISWTEEEELLAKIHFEAKWTERTFAVTAPFTQRKDEAASRTAYHTEQARMIVEWRELNKAQAADGST